MQCDFWRLTLTAISDNRNRVSSPLTGHSADPTSNANARCQISLGDLPSPKGFWLFSPPGTESPLGGKGQGSGPRLANSLIDRASPGGLSGR